MNKKIICRITAALLTVICLLGMSGCHMLDVTVDWNIPKIRRTYRAAAVEQAQAEPSTSATAMMPTQPVTNSSTQGETTTAPVQSEKTALDIYNEALKNSVIQGVVLGSKFSSLTVDIGDKETFDGLGNVHDFSKSHDLDAADFSLPAFSDPAQLAVEETDESYIITCDSSDILSADIPVRQITGYVYFLDIAAVDGIFSLLGGEKADGAIYDSMGDGKVSMKNGSFTCEISKAEMKFTSAKLLFEETFDDIVKLSFPKDFSADLTMNITLGFSF